MKPPIFNYPDSNNYLEALKEHRIKCKEYKEYQDKLAAERNERKPGGYMSTRNSDGSSRGGAAEMFERYGFF